MGTRAGQASTTAGNDTATVDLIQNTASATATAIARVNVSRASGFC